MSERTRAYGDRAFQRFNERLGLSPEPEKVAPSPAPAAPSPEPPSAAARAGRFLADVSRGLRGEGEVVPGSLEAQGYNPQVLRAASELDIWPLRRGTPAEEESFAREHPVLLGLRERTRQNFFPLLRTGLRRALPESEQQDISRQEGAYGEAYRRAAEPGGLEPGATLSKAEKVALDVAGGFAGAGEFLAETAALAPVMGPAAPFGAVAVEEAAHGRIEGRSWPEIAARTAKGSLLLAAAGAGARRGRAFAEPYGQVAQRTAAGVAGGGTAGATSLALGDKPEEAAHTAGMFGVFEAAQRPARVRARETPRGAEPAPESRVPRETSPEISKKPEVLQPEPQTLRGTEPETRPEGAAPKPTPEPSAEVDPWEIADRIKADRMRLQPDEQVVDRRTKEMVRVTGTDEAGRVMIERESGKRSVVSRGRLQSERDWEFERNEADRKYQQIMRDGSRKERYAAKGRMAQWDRLYYEPETPPAVPAAKGAPSPEPVVPTSKMEIRRHIEKSFGFPIFGKMTSRWPSNRLGQFVKRPEVVQLRHWGDMPSLAHETGHGIDKTLGKRLGKRWMAKLPEAAKAELQGLDYEPEKGRAKEGFSEFIRRTTSGESPQDVAPEFARKWDEILQEQPDIARGLAETKDLYGRHARMNPEQRILSQIDRRGELMAKRPLKERAARALRRARLDWEDANIALKEFEEKVSGGKPIRPTKSPFDIATATKFKARSVARFMVNEAMVDEYGRPIGPPLRKILKGAGIGTEAKDFINPEKLDNFGAYYASLRAKELHAEGKRTGFDPADVEAMIQKFDSPEWREAARGLTEWNNELVKRLARSGRFSEEQTQAIIDAYEVYAPFMRVFGDEMERARARAGKPAGAPSGIHRYKGGEQPIRDPVQASFERARKIIALADMNRIKTAMFDLIDAHPEGAGKYAFELPKAAEGRSYRADDLKRALEEYGLRVENLNDADMDKMLVLFGSAREYRGREPVITRWKNGVREDWRVDPDLYTAMTEIEMRDFGPVTKAMEMFARTTRLGATGLKPSFGLFRNPVKDTMTRQALTKSRRAAPWDTITGAISDLTDEPGYRAGIARGMGGEMSTIPGYDRAATIAILDDALAKNLGARGVAFTTVRHPLNSIRAILGVFEMGPRIKEFEQRMGQLRKEHPDWTEDDVRLRAFNEMQDVTTNFTRMGRRMPEWNARTAFINSGIQGPSKFLRRMREAPATTVALGMTSIGSVALASWYQNKDKDWYQNLPPAYKYGNIFVEVGDHVWKVPLPFELGVIFGALPVALFDRYYHDDPEAMKAVLELLKQNAPNIIWSAVGPALDVAMNKDYLGRPIETESMQRLPKTQRSRSYTTRWAKMASKGFNKLGIELSPAQIDYLVWNYTGGLPGQIPGYRGGTGLENTAVIGDLLLKERNRPARQLNDFYTALRHLRELKAAVRAEQKGKPVEGKMTLREAQSLRVLESAQRNIVGPLSQAIAKADADDNKVRAEVLEKQLRRSLEQTLRNAGIKQPKRTYEKVR